MRKLWRHAVISSVLLVITIGLAAPALAHEERTVGKLKFTVGWGNEPTYAGSENSVLLLLADAKGKPITDLGDSLKVEVIFSGQTVTLPLEATLDPDSGEGTPGDYRGWLIPTRPGIYTFHFTGTYKGQKIDQRFTASDTTFDVVKDPATVQFPAKDLSAGALNDLVTRNVSRLSADIKKAHDSASTATILAIVSLVVGVLGSGAALVARRSRKRA
jgi:hypothetical protein